MRRRVVVFDFDGTLTRHDTFIEFIRYARGPWRLYGGLLLFLPMLLLMKCRLYSNSKAKESVFSFFFKGVPYQQFKDWGRAFAPVVDSFCREDVRSMLHQHVAEGASVYVVSASMEEWVRPWCEQMGVADVLATRVGVDGKGLLTGLLAGANCYGQEKVNRLLEAEPRREEYTLVAYGDSRGDREMIAFADEGTYV